MKNRNKFLPKAALKRSESNIPKNLPEKPRKKQIFTSVSLQQNLEFFQRTSSFPKPLLNCGDADSYFKQTLRSYDHFDLAVFKKVTTRAKSSENLRRKTSFFKLKTPTSTRSQKPKTKKKVLKKKEVEESEVFYSPNSLRSSEVSEQTLKNNSTQEPVKEELKMAEEGEDLENVFGEETEAGETTEVEETTEDEMQEVGSIIKQAAEELAEENQQVQDMQEGEEYEEQAAGDGSYFKFDPAIDSAVLRELEEAEKQAKATAKIIYELKTRVMELLQKDKHTEAEARELEEKNQELRAQMCLFEQKTKRIQFLIAQTNLFDKMVPPDTPLQVRRQEDKLPKVVVCGLTDTIPKLILCDEKKKLKKPEATCNEVPTLPINVAPTFAKRLSDSYNMQERLAAENADLEGMRYKLQSDLLTKDQTIEYLQKQLGSIQCEMRLLCKENSTLNEKIQEFCNSSQHKQDKCKKMSPKRSKSCKSCCQNQLEGRLSEYSETTKVLEKQLVDMENDVKTMQAEINAVQAEREHLEQHKKVIICPPVCAPPPCMPCTPCFNPCAEQQLGQMKEQYCRLQDDYKSKVCEVGGLRADNEKLKANIKEAEEARKAFEEKVKELERTIKCMKMESNKFAGSKEQLVEQEQQLAVAKQRFREAQDELEELRSFIQEQNGQLDDYRNKYLEAQQEVEEQRRQIDMLEMDANRVNEQVNLEIQRVKNQFQEKLQELLPLPDVLKQTQIKLQEVQQMHLLAERNNEALNRDLQIYKDKIQEITDQLDRVKSDNEFGAGEKQAQAQRMQEMEARIKELDDENCELRQLEKHYKETLDDTERELQSKLHEVAQLSAQLESVREESARQVARNKERCETVRRSMQNQISDLERQLAQSRAQARAAQKDRDEIRQKMQSQINNLHENFEDAQMRIRSLQGHVNFLKESYNTSPKGLDVVESVPDQYDPCVCGREF